MIFEVSLSYCLMALPARNVNNVRIDEEGFLIRITHKGIDGNTLKIWFDFIWI